MIRIFRPLTVAVALLFAGTVSAKEPWKQPRPRGMTEAHDRYAASAYEVYKRLGTEFNGHPGEFHRRTWTWQGGRNGLRPLSNMEAAEIRKLLSGRYFVYRDNLRGNTWSARYHSPEGKVHYCLGQPDGSFVTQEPGDVHYYDSVFGLAGINYYVQGIRPEPNEQSAWPIVGNGKTGQFAHFGWDNNEWSVAIGWIQAEYAAGFAEKCPDLPRVARVNNNQRGETIQDMARGAKAITGFRTAFESDPADPLTVGMFYWAYPPQ